MASKKSHGVTYRPVPCWSLAATASKMARYVRSTSRDVLQGRLVIFRAEVSEQAYPGPAALFKQNESFGLDQWTDKQRPDKLLTPPGWAAIGPVDRSQPEGGRDALSHFTLLVAASLPSAVGQSIWR